MRQRAWISPRCSKFKVCCVCVYLSVCEFNVCVCMCVCGAVSLCVCTCVSQPQRYNLFPLYSRCASLSPRSEPVPLTGTMSVCLYVCVLCPPSVCMSDTQETHTPWDLWHTHAWRPPRERKSKRQRETKEWIEKISFQKSTQVDLLLWVHAV